ncbi:hypothetical protein AZL_004460 [Azospirillum sp. B510]|uniref:hypothetical protein n=1 Tax=Azospirillum sp. (strain B510) TaxID=137722 RepID=UPI0001C4BD59|nr:hypothetical protein [Azospirillum sp. B510]BAI71084.1 hypothetical protein AZL_004460 [Azospirillum sp. B510]
MTARKPDVAGVAAMLTGVFAKAAEAKGKPVRADAPSVAAPSVAAPSVARAAVPKPAMASGREPSVRLSLGPEAAGDGRGRPSGGSGGDLVDRLEPAIRALARDFGRLLAAFGMAGKDAEAAEAALAGRFDAVERRAAIVALDGPAGELRPLAGEDRQDVSVALRDIGLTLIGGRVEVRLEDAALMLARVPPEERGEGVLGILRSALRPGKGLTVETDRVAIDDLGPVIAALAAAMATPPQGLEGTVTLSPLGAPAADGGAMELSLSLSGRLGDAAAGSTSTQRPAEEKPVDEIGARGFDVRI